MLNFPDYNIYGLDRDYASRVGGAALYLCNDILSNCILKEHRDIWKSNVDIEIQLIELKIRNIRKIILVNVYRPPSGKVDNFIAALTEALESINFIHEYDVFIMGDCNLPYNLTNSPSYKKLKGFESRFRFTQLIKFPTRITPNCQNILDLI